MEFTQLKIPEFHTTIFIVLLLWYCELLKFFEDKPIWKLGNNETFIILTEGYKKAENHQ